MRRFLLFFFLCLVVFPIHSVLLYFEVGTTELTNTSRQDLVTFKEEFETFFQQNPQTLIFITGHTDNTGTDALNKQLSLSRAGLIREYLVNDLNVNPQYIKIFGKGSQEPVESNDDETGRNLNRRVEIVFEKPEAQIKWLQNIVEYTPSKSGKTLSAEPEVVLFRYDKINTEDHSRSGIEFNETNMLILEENSLMIIYGDISSSFSNLLDDKFHVELKYGGLYNKLENMHDKSINIKTPAAELELYSSLNSVEFNENRTLASVYVGYGLVLAKGNSVKVNEGYGIEVTVGDEPGEPVKLPDIPLNLHISKTQPTLKGELVTLQWEGSSTEYLIQLSPASEFQDLLDGVTVQNTAAQLNLDYGEYYIRLQARDKIGLTSPFTEAILLQVIEQVYLFCNDLKQDETYKTDMPVLHFSGTALDQVEVYQKDSQLTKTEENTFSGSYPLEFGLNQLNLKAVLPDLSEKIYSYHILFQPEVDKTVKFLNLTSEVQNSVDQENFTILAEASEFTHLFLNNKEFTSDASGNFQTDIILARGLNELTIKADFIDGSTAVYNFELIYDKADRMTTLEIIAALSAILITSIPLLINWAK